MSNEERRELAAAQAFGRLSAEERAALADAVAADPLLARELESDRATIAALEAKFPREVPSPELLDRIMAEVESLEAAERRRSQPPSDRPRRRFALPSWPRLGLATAAAAAAVVIGVLLLGRDDLGEPDAVATLAGAPAYSGVTGEAKLYDSDREGGTLVVRLGSTPPPPPGHHYEVWVLRNGTELMQPVGELSVATLHRELEEHEFRLESAGSFAAIEVSVEPNDGDPDYSGVSLAGGLFTS